MRFEKITDTKIRIILSLKDMELNNLSVENVLSNSADSQKLLESMISRAEEELGFKPENSQLLVEATVPSSNECIFTITKLLDKKMCIPEKSNSFIFQFDCFDDFINLCTFLNNFSCLCLKEISQHFSLIYHNNTYYIRFKHMIDSLIVLDYIKTFFAEFGKDVSNSPGIDGVLNEYGKVIYEKNAIIKCLNSFVKKHT